MEMNERRSGKDRRKGERRRSNRRSRKYKEPRGVIAEWTREHAKLFMVMSIIFLVMGSSAMAANLLIQSEVMWGTGVTALGTGATLKTVVQFLLK